MEKWNFHQRTFIVQRYFKNSSYIQTIREFRAQFSLRPRDTIPTHLTINRWVKNFRDTHSVSKNKPPGQPASVRTPKNQDRRRDVILTSPTRSGRKQAQVLEISRRSFRRMVPEMHFHPYKMILTQELKVTAALNDQTFAQRMKAALRNGTVMRKILLISDETHLYLCETVNFHYYADSNPECIVKKPLYAPRVTVWCGAV